MPQVPSDLPTLRATWLRDSPDRSFPMCFAFLPDTRGAPASRRSVGAGSGGGVDIEPAERARPRGDQKCKDGPPDWRGCVDPTEAVNEAYRRLRSAAYHPMPWCRWLGIGCLTTASYVAPPSRCQTRARGPLYSTTC